MKNYIVLAIFVMAMSPIVYGYTYSDYDWSDFGGHKYALTLEYSNWAQAEAWAQEVGGHLITINNDEENAWVADFIKASYVTPGTIEPHNNIAWIGLEYTSGDMSSPNAWQWTNGEPLAFWNPIEGEFPCGTGVHMYIHGLNHDYSPETWNNNPDCDSYLFPRGVIEIPEPATILLLAFGGLILRRRK